MVTSVRLALFCFRLSSVSVILCAVILGVLHCSVCKAATLAEREISSPVYDNAKQRVLPLQLYFTPSELPAIKEWYFTRRGEADKFKKANLASYFRPILSALEAMKSRGPAYARPEGMWQLSACAFAFALTEDKECCQAVRDMLVYLCNLDTWSSSGSGAPFEESFIVTQIVICYDLIYPALSEGDRTLIGAAIEEKGLRRIRSYVVGGNWTLSAPSYHGSPGYLQHSNQGATFMGAIYLGARLLYHQTSKTHYKDEYVAAARAIEVLLYNYFSPDGGVTAAPGYYLMTLGELQYSILAVAKTLGRSVASLLPPLSRNPFLFSLYLRSNAAQVHNPERYPCIVPFGDSSYTFLIYDPVKREGVGTRYWALAVWSGYVNDPGLLWMYERFANLPEVEFNESAASLVSHYRRAILLESTCPSPPALCNDRLFSNTGLITWRDGFEEGDKMFALWKRVYQRGDHLQFSQNSILLEAYGERFLTHRGVDYTRDEKLGFSRSSSYNSVTVEWENNLDGSSRTEVSPYFTSESLNYARSDGSFNERAPFLLKDPWRRRFAGAISEKADVARRSVIYIKPDYYIVLDSIGCRQRRHIQGNYVSAVEVERQGRWICYRGKASFLYQYTASLEDLEFHVLKTIDDKSAPIWAATLGTGNSVTELSMVNLLFPIRKGIHRPEVTHESNASGTSIIIRRGKCKEVVVQRRLSSSVASMKDVRTDGEAAVLLFKNEQLTCVGIFKGTVLEYKQRRLVSADSVSSVIAYPNANNIYGTAQSDEGTRVTFHLASEPIVLSLSNTDSKGYCSFGTFR